jgi:hypothetical protein
MKHGFTIAELSVGLVIFTMVMGMAIFAFLGMRQTVDGMHRLDIFHDLRSTSRIITGRLAPATEILHPPADGKPHHQLFFLTRTNEVAAIFLNNDGQLLMVNHDRQKAGKSDAIQVLARRSIEFLVVREDEAYVSFKIRILDAKGFEFSLTDGISLKNVIR